MGFLLFRADVDEELEAFLLALEEDSRLLALLLRLLFPRVEPVFTFVGAIVIRPWHSQLCVKIVAV